MSTDILPIDDVLGFSHLSPTIAAELAARLISPKDVPEKYKMSSAQWDRLKNTPLFLKMMQEAGQRLTGDLGASARITLKAELILEDALPVLDTMIHATEGSTQSKLDSVKQLAVLAGRTQHKEGGKGGPVGGGFNVSIQINTGEGNAPEAPVIIQAAED